MQDTEGAQLMTAILIWVLSTFLKFTHLFCPSLSTRIVFEIYRIRNKQGWHNKHTKIYKVLNTWAF